TAQVMSTAEPARKNCRRFNPIRTLASFIPPVTQTASMWGITMNGAMSRIVSRGSLLIAAAVLAACAAKREAAVSPAPDHSVSPVADTPQVEESVAVTDTAQQGHVRPGFIEPAPPPPSPAPVTQTRAVANDRLARTEAEMKMASAPI